MLARTLRILVLLIVSGAMVCAFIYGRGIPFADQKPILDTLVSVSAIVFGVMGAWIALVYPKGLTGLFTKSRPDADQYERVKRLFSPMKYATIIIAYALVLQVVVPILKQVPKAAGHYGLGRGLSLAVLVGLIGLQLWTLFVTLAPIDEAEEHLEIGAAAQKSIDRRTARVHERPERTDGSKEPKTP